MKRKVISISGNVAGGKSEVCNILSDMLCMQIYAASDSFRAMARNLNMDLVKFNEYIKDKPEIDYEIEKKTAEYIKDKENIILDARLGWYVVPESFKVYIKIDIDVACKRLKEFSKRRGKEEKYDSEESARKAIIIRQELEKQRYKTQYNVDLSDESNYDLVIDSSDKELYEVADEIAKAYRKWLNENN